MAISARQTQLIVNLHRLLQKCDAEIECRLMPDGGGGEPKVPLERWQVEKVPMRKEHIEMTRILISLFYFKVD